MVKLARHKFEFEIVDVDLSPTPQKFTAKPLHGDSTFFSFTPSAGYDNNQHNAVFDADLGKGLNEPFLITDKRIVYTWTVAGPQAGNGTLTFEYLKIPKSLVMPLAKHETLIIDNFLIFRDYIANNSEQASVRITVHGANDAPVAKHDLITTTDHVRVLKISPLANDTDIDHGETERLGIDDARVLHVDLGPDLPSNLLPATITPLDDTHDFETLTLHLNPFLYFLRENQSFKFTIEYTVTDPYGGRDTAFVFVTVRGTNDREINGNGAGNYLLGEPDEETINGLGGNDHIIAKGGNDRLNGGGGNDILTGGLGKDYLRGNAGADRFDFNKAAESAKGAARDRILDFSRSQKDKIDLSSIDADRDGTSGNQKFTFIGTAGFHGRDGELRCSGGIIQGDTNGDKIADFEIKVNVSTLQSSDFAL